MKTEKVNKNYHKTAKLIMVSCPFAGGKGKMNQCDQLGDYSTH